MIDRIAGLVNPRPMVVITLAFILGIILEQKLEVELIIMLIIIMSLVVIQLVFFRAYSRVIIILLLTFAGSIRFATYEMQSGLSLAYFPAKPDSAYEVTASVEKIGETRRGTPKYFLAPISIDNQRISEGLLLLYAKDLETIPDIGDTLIAAILLNQPRGQRNPHDFDYRNYLINQGIFYEGFLDDEGQVIIHESSNVTASQLMLALRDLIKFHFLKDLSSRSAGIMSALILGERSDVDDQTKTDFANTGVIHVLAVSGLHVGYVSLILITMIGMLRLSHLPKTLLVILGLGFYVILTGGAASVMRASIMAGLILSAGLIERKSDIFNILATAAMIILMIDPTQLTGIGFQLSFSAVLSIVTLFPVLRKWVPMISINIGILDKLLNAIVDLFLVSLAAQLGTLALTIYYFNKIPIISLAANIIVVPLIGMIVATGLSSLLIGSIFPVLARQWAALLDGIIDFMLWFVQLCARFDWAFITTRSIHAYEVVLILAAVFAITILQRWRLLLLWFILLLSWSNVMIWSNLIRSPELEVVMLDVGQGDAIVVHTPQGKTMVIDAGLSFGGKDMGRDVISPYLIQRNWNEIDLLVLTHPHNDHIGGADYLLNHHATAKVLMQDINYDSYGYRKLQLTLDSLQIPTVGVCTGVIDSSMAPVYLRVTGPKLFDTVSQPSNVNNVSIVMQVFYGQTSLLLTGDAEQEVEDDQLAFGALLQSDLIKAPHHGSRTSSTLSYINRVNPDICLISVGTGNKYRHPAPGTLKHYAELGTQVHRTDLEGALLLNSDGIGWEYLEWRPGP